MIPLLVMGAAAVAALAISKKKSPEVDRGETLATPEKIAKPETMPTSLSQIVDEAKKQVRTDVVGIEKTIDSSNELTLKNLISEKVFFEKPYTGIATKEELILPKEAIEEKMAQKQGKTVDVPLVVATKKEVTLNDLVLEIPSKPSPSRIVKNKFIGQLVNLKREPNLFERPSDLHFYRFFQTPGAKEFAAKLQSIGFGRTIGDVQEDKWDKFFIWLEKVQMPDMSRQLSSSYPYEHAKILIQEAESRGLLNESGFRSLQDFLANTRKFSATPTYLKDA